MTQAQAEDLKAKLRASARGRQPVVVPQGTSLQALASDADGAQLGETRRWNSLLIAQAIGVPGVLLGLDAQGLVYRNLQDIYGQWISTTLLGYVAPIEQQITAQLLPRSMEARFDTTSILRPDFAGRVDLAVKGLQGRVMTTDEARSLVDLAPADVPADPPQLSLVPSQEVVQ